MLSDWILLFGRLNLIRPRWGRGVLGMVFHGLRLPLFAFTRGYYCLKPDGLWGYGGNLFPGAYAGAANLLAAVWAREGCVLNN